MRDFKNMKRQRGRNRGGGNNSGAGARPQQNANRAFESNGPDNVKIRGHAQHVFERYQQLARDAFSSGDRVLAENYLQHADHYFRLLRTIQPHRPASEILGRDTVASGLDIDFEEEFEAPQEDASAPESSEGGDGQQGFEPRQDGGRQDGNRYDRDTRQDRYEGGRGDGQRAESNWRDRQDNRPETRQDNRPDNRSDNRPDTRADTRQDRDRQDNRAGFDRADRADRPYNDRQDRNRNYGDRPQDGERVEGRRDNRRFDNRNVARDGREPRLEPRPEGFAEGPQPSPEPFEPTPAVERVEPGPVLRSEDGLTSAAPAFLQPAAGDGDEARPRARRRRAPRTFQPGEDSAEPAAPATEEG
jgi:hypothetical protein